MPVSIQNEATPEEVQVFTDGIDQGIDMFCEENNIDRSNMIGMPQAVWTACLIYIHKNVLNDPLLLKSKPNINNAYNFDKVNKLYDLYVYYSSLYNKVISISDYCHLSGIDSSYIQQWNNDNGKFNTGDNMLSDKGYKFLQKVRNDREKALTGRIISTGNAVGLLGVANREYGWNQPASASAAIGYQPKPRQIPVDPDKPVPKPPELPQKHTQ